MMTVFGREDRIRTCDPLVPNQVFYRAELPPELSAANTDINSDFNDEKSAVREGFEPSVQSYPYGSLANY